MSNHYSLSDLGYSPDDYEEPGPLRCSTCGAFLPTPTTEIVTYGEPGHQWQEPRDISKCTKCGASNDICG